MIGIVATTNTNGTRTSILTGSVLQSFIGQSSNITLDEYGRDEIIGTAEILRKERIAYPLPRNHINIWCLIAEFEFIEGIDEDSIKRMYIPSLIVYDHSSYIHTLIEEATLDGICLLPRHKSFDSYCTWL